LARHPEELPFADVPFAENSLSVEVGEFVSDSDPQVFHNIVHTSSRNPASAPVVGRFALLILRYS